MYCYMIDTSITRSFDATRSEKFWINLFYETQNPFSDSFGFKNPILDFLKETQRFTLQHDVNAMAFRNTSNC